MFLTGPDRDRQYSETETMKIALDTLGCKLNQAETERLARGLSQAGHEVVPDVNEADIYILNSCTVTHTADSKSRHRLRQAHRRNPDALIVATGCYAQRAGRELARIEGVNLVIDNNDKARLPRLIDELSGFNRPSSRFSNVVLPTPFGPMMPTRSPRRIVVLKSRTTGRPSQAKFTSSASTTSLPDRSASWTTRS